MHTCSISVSISSWSALASLDTLTNTTGQRVRMSLEERSPKASSGCECNCFVASNQPSLVKYHDSMYSKAAIFCNAYCNRQEAMTLGGGSIFFKVTNGGLLLVLGLFSRDFGDFLPSVLNPLLVLLLVRLPREDWRVLLRVHLPPGFL